MNQTILLAAITAIISSAHPAVAQEKEMVQMRGNSRAALLTLTQRYEFCLHNEECSVNDRLELLNDMNNATQSITTQLSQKCIEMNYYGCIDVQSGKIRNLARLNRQASDIIATLDPANGYIPRGPYTQDDPYILNRQSPAAGPTRKNSWWKEFFSSRSYNPSPREVPD